MSRKGSIFYIVVTILSVLAGVASILIDVSRDEGYSTALVYRSEIAINLAEAAVDEFYTNVQKMMNSRDKGPVGGIYEKLREEFRPDTDIDIDQRDISNYLCPASIQLCRQYNTEKDKDKCSIRILAAVTQMEPLNINPVIADENGKSLQRPGVKKDLKEKKGILQVQVEVVFEDYTKKLVVTRSLKVVNTTIAPLSVFTLFINEPGFPWYANWASKYGMHWNNDQKGMDPPSLVLDHGWHHVLKEESISREKMAEAVEEDLLLGKVPPGRVFMNTAVVPLTNGNLEAGMLQNAFFTAETELLPPRSVVNFEDSKTVVSQARDKMSEEEKKLLEEILPDSGELYTRYIGHGHELKADELEVNGKKRKGYKEYFESWISTWEKSPRKPYKSGLDLFGRVRFKPGVLDKEDPQTGIFASIVNAAKDAFETVLEQFVNDNYLVEISPTLVYGKVLMSYYRVMDYKYTRGDELKQVWKKRQEREKKDEGWFSSLWDSVKEVAGKIANTLRIGALGPGQYPLAEVSPQLLEGISDTDMKKPFVEKDKEKFIAQGWSEKTWQNFLDLPDGLRTPLFFKFLLEVKKNQQSFFGEDLSTKVPDGAILAPYNMALPNYVRPDIEKSRLIKIFSDQKNGMGTLSQTGYPFLDNPVDQQLQSQWGGEYISPLSKYLDAEMPLKSFNPFLYYRKATEYISSIYDFRNSTKKQKVHTFKKKYYDEKDGCLDMNGVIYVTGTAHPLRFSELASSDGTVLYKGKSIIISFGEVIFDCPVRKFGYKSKPGPRWGEDAPLLTVVALGGIRFDTNQEVDATVFSFMYPPTATRHFVLNGTLGASDLSLERLNSGGMIRFDPSYSTLHLSGAQLDSYYWASLTDEIKDFSWKVGW